MEVEITNRPHFAKVDTLTIVIERIWWEPRIPNPTEQEMAVVPDRFRCYSCLKMKGRKRLGGLILEQFICRACFPWLNESRVSAIIRFDRWHGFQHYIRQP